MLWCKSADVQARFLRLYPVEYHDWPCLAWKHMSESDALPNNLTGLVSESKEVYSYLNFVKPLK